MMNDPDSPAPSSAPRRSSAKRASAASVGATVLLLIGYLVASWLGIPLDGLLTSSGGPQGQPSAGSDRPVAAARDDQAPRAPVTKRNGSSSARVAPAAQDSPYQIENVTVRNLDGEVAFQGTVDLTETMHRIDAGRRLSAFRNDGTTFQNRERRLPLKERGYYTEYVHPTPRLSGPGPQRVVTGKSGEAYYTSDHYETFQRIR